MMQALVGRKVEFWYGHIHTNVNYSLTAAEIAKYAPGVLSLGSHIVARCGGTWDCSQEICTDGSPRGWLELDIDGTSSTWNYHSIEADYPSVMKAYAPGQFKGEGLAKYDATALYINIYSWDNSWSQPQVTVGGTTSDMTKVTQNKDAAYDPMYQHFYPIWKAEGKMATRDVTPDDSDNMHLFKYVPASGVKSAEVSVKDKWGKTHTMTVTW